MWPMGLLFYFSFVFFNVVQYVGKRKSVVFLWSESCVLSIMVCLVFLLASLVGYFL